jgi:enediyne biosynthesis protein E4
VRAALALLVVSSLPAAQIRFEDIAQKSGLKFKLNNGATGAFHQIELMTGGVGVLDFNRDGCMDIFFVNGAASPSLDKTKPEFHNRLFQNDCKGHFTDVTDRAGVAGTGYSMAVAIADYDNDGFPDIFVAGVDRNILYHNEHDGTFKDVTRAAGLEGIDPVYGKMWAASAGWFDADNDGWLDLFVSNYVGWDPRREPACGLAATRFYCHPQDYPGRPNQLFRNNHEGTFTDISQSSGIAKSIGKGMGVAFGDFNRDGRMDIFVANDSVRNFLFENLGGGKFREVGLEAGVSLGESGRPVAGMGADFRDIDNDGLPDIVLTGMINDTFLFFHNLGKPYFFEDRTLASGLAVATRQLTGWSMGAFDFDNDGWKDLFFANSHFPNLEKLLGVPAQLACSVFQNIHGRFQDSSASAGESFRHPAFYRGAAFADFDNDGRVDVVVTALNEPARLYRNVTEGAGHWLAVHLVGTRSNRDAIGAELQASLPDGTQFYNQVSTSVGYASSSEPLTRFGLGTQTRVSVLRVFWPSGHTQLVRDIPADRLIEVRENPVDLQ